MVFSLPVSYASYDLRPILQHRDFMPGANVHSELAVARRLHRPQPIRKFRARACECEGANDVGVDDVMLLRAQKH